MSKNRKRKEKNSGGTARRENFFVGQIVWHEIIHVCI
jgi:hypothetical protein